MIVSINIHLTNLCNYGDCAICFEDIDNENPVILDKEKLFAFLEDIKPSHVGFVGESLTHPDINEILQWCRDHTIDTCLVTNGILASKLTVMPDNISIGIDNNQEWNQPIIEFLASGKIDKSKVEITITPTNIDAIDGLIEFYKDKSRRINFSMLAFWDKKSAVTGVITPEYIAKMKELKERSANEKIVFFGDIVNIDNFYAQKIAEGERHSCSAPLNIYPDGHLEFCDLNYFSHGQTITDYDKETLTKDWTIQEHCKVCTLKRRIS